MSLDWETSLLMLARVGLRHQRVAQNKIQFILEEKQHKVKKNCEDPKIEEQRVGVAAFLGCQRAF